MKTSAKGERGRLRRAIVVGAGRAGLTATLELAEQGVPVHLLSLGPSTQAQSNRDREGFNAGHLDPNDSVAQHARDTLSAGAGLAPVPAVERLCQAAPELLEWLAGLGVPFSRQQGGRFAHVRLPGSSRARTAHAEASTGRNIVSSLDALVRAQEELHATDEFGVLVPGERLVRRTDHWRFVSLVLDDRGAAVGVLAQDCRTLAFKTFTGDGIILATGDYAALFAESASSQGCTGAALGAVFKQGAVLSNPEFVAHHPLVVVDGALSLALPELLRAYGARLSAPRTKQGDEPLMLDLSPLASEVRERLLRSLGPALGNLLGVDLTRDTVSVQSRASAGLGGLWIDGASDSSPSPRAHATSIPGLYAAGGAAAEYHGAACLPGNLGLAALLGARRAARGVVAHRASLEKSAFDLPKSVFEKRAAEAESEFEALFKREATPTGDHPHGLLRELRAAMARGCGPRRNADGLEELQEQLGELGRRLSRASVRGPGTGWNQDALLLASLPDSLTLARCIVSAALAREESRGAHVRSDFTAPRSTLDKASWFRAGASHDPEPLESFDYESAGETVSIAR